MKEEEAKTKWCPMYRVGFHPELSHNRISDGKSGNCIASDCMWWVWDTADVNGVNTKGHCGAVK